MKSAGWNGSERNSGISARGQKHGRSAIEVLEQRRLLTAAVMAVYTPVSEFLSKPDGVLSAPSKAAPKKIATSYLSAHAGNLGLKASDLSNAIITDQYTDPDTGTTHIYFQQQYQGQPIDRTSINVNILKNGSVLSVGGAFVPKIASSVSAAHKLNKTSMTARAALQSLTALDLSIPADEMIPPSTAGHGGESFVLEGVAAGEVTPVRALVATANGVTEAWHINLLTTDGDHWYDSYVDMSTGQIVALSDWVDNAETYNVYPAPLEAPNDGPGGTIARSIVTNPADPVASPFGWHDTNGVAGAEFTDTRGNNVSAQDDTNADNAGGFRPDGGAQLNYDFPLDLTQSPSAYQSTAITNLFYWNNLLHDVHMHYGFTEAAGNFQVMNYSAQGLGNDAVQADAQDGSGTNNANFATPPDGTAPRMQMYLFNSTSPSRDGDLSADIIAHEYGHGVSNRLTGGPANSNALDAVQSGGMGEGWSDFWSLMFTQKPTDTKTGSNSVGTYVLGQTTSGAGIRRFPYSYDMAKDPLTLDAYGTSGTGGGTTRSTEVHNSGEIWCTTLWDLNWLLIDKYGYSQQISQGYDPNVPGKNGGNNLALQLVMDALKLQPANPSFLQARDAILQADQVRTGGANQLAIWTAFARRGMGVSAVDSSSSATSITAAYDIPVGLQNPVVSGQTPTGVLFTPPSFVDLTFSKAMDPNSFSLASDVNSFTGPNGVDLRSQLTSFSWSNGNQTLRLNFNPQSLNGQYSLSVGPQILGASDAHPMDQNGNGVSGEAGDAYVATFRYDATLGTVASTVPANASLVPLPLTSIDLNFTEPFTAGSISASDLVLNQGSVTGVTIVDADTARFTISGVTTEGTLALSVAAGAVTDADGNPMGTYSGSLQLDFGTVSFPTPFVARGAAGSLIYDSSVSGVIGTAGDVDTFTVSLDAGQTLTVLADPAGSLRPHIELRGPQGNVIGSADSAATGADALLQTISVTSSGTYTIAVSSVGSLTSGSYTLKATLNAALEAENQNGPTNDTLATAQDLDGSFQPVAGLPDGSVAAVLGKTPAPTGTVLVSDGFETGSLGAAWTTYSSVATGRILVTGADSTAAGSFAMIMDNNDSAGATFNLNEAVWTVNLAGVSSPTLTFSTIAFSDETETLPTTFTGHSNGDGVAISADGTNWYTIWTGAAPTTWTSVSVNLAAAAATAGMSLGANFKIKFQQYDNYNYSTDGRGYDSIAISVPAASSDYYKFSATAGDRIALDLSRISTGTDTLAVTLYNSAGTVVATGTSTATNAASAIDSYTVTATDVYYALVTGGGSDYSLSVGRKVAFELEANNTIATAQSLSGRSGVVGATDGLTNTKWDFESGASGFVIANGTTGLWHLSTGRATQAGHSATHSFYFGTGETSTGGGTYNTGGATAGTLTSPAFVVAAGGMLNFNYVLQTENSTAWDLSQVLISIDNGTSWTTLASYNGVAESTTWKAATPISLASYVGKSALLRWSFNTIDSGSNAFEGWYVDDISVGATVAGDDYYSLPLTAGQTLNVLTSTPGDGSGEFANTLDPKLELFNSSGVSLAVNDNGAADGRNARISYTVASAGTYYVRVTAAGSTKGEYVLAVNPQPTITFTAPSDLQETAGSVSATLSIVSPAATDTVVTLTSSDPSRLLVPATVLIPAGQTSAAFNLSVLDNADLDGAESVTISTSAPTFAPGSRIITVHDDETTTLAVQLPPIASEGSGPVSGTITAAIAPTRDIVVTLASDRTARATVPATVTLLAGQTSVAFPLTIIENTVVDLTQTVNISAAVENWTPGAAAVAVADNDNTIQVVLGTSGFEGQTLTGSIRLGGIAASPIVVSLLSSDLTELTVPATVTVPAGQSSVTFSASLLTDGLKDDNQTALVTASATGFNSVSSSVVVHDADLDHLTFDTITGPKTAAVAFSATARAFNIANEAITVYAGPATFGASGQSSGSLPLTPTSGTFTGGIWTGNITVSAVDPAATLKVTAGAVSASSNAFALTAGALAGFQWGAISSLQVANVPFAATLTAKDANGFTVANYNGSVSLTGQVGTGLANQNMLGSPTFTNSGNNGTYTVGYLFTLSSNLDVTHVRSYFGTKVSFWTNTGSLLASQAVASSATSWTETPLSSTLHLLAGTTYRITVLTGGQTYYWRNVAPTNPTFATLGQTYEISGDAFPTTPDTGQYWLVDLKATVGTFAQVPISPTTATFTSGVWTGNVNVSQAATGMLLHATDTLSHAADSNTFNVILKTLALTLPTLPLEGDGVVNATLNVVPAPTSDLVVTLSSSASDRASLPATVTIPAGQSSVPIPITIIDNDFLDGSQLVTVTATGSGYQVGVSTMTVRDNESSSLTVTLPATATEGGAPVVGTLTAAAAPTRDITVALSSSLTTRGTVPATVTLLAGQTTANFNLTLVNNTIIDGTQPVTISAAIDNWTTTPATVSVADNDSTIAVSIATSGFEGSTLIGTVALGGTSTSAVVVSLTSSDTTELTLPVTVTIPAGLTSVTFSASLLTDALKDGSQTALISATANGLTSASASVIVRDADLDHLAFDTITGPKTAAVAFSATARAFNIANELITVFTGTPVVTGTGQSGSPVTITPVSGTFTGGVWTGNIAVNAVDPAVTLKATVGTISGSSNVFAVNAGALASFQWSTIPSAQSANTPFPTSITAKDANGFTANYNGTAVLSGLTGTATGSTIVITEALLGTPDAVEFTNVSTSPVNLSGWQAFIYDIDFFPAPTITFTFPTGTIIPAGGVFKIEEFGATPGTYPSFYTGVNIDWTSSATTAAAVLLRNSSSQIVDFFAGGAASPTSISNPTTIPTSQWSGSTATSPTTDTTTYSRTGNQDHNNASDWVVATASINTQNTGLTIPFPGGFTSVPISPTTATFVNGVWTGNVTVVQQTIGMYLNVDDGAGHAANSNTFDVLDPNRPTGIDLLDATDSGVSPTDNITNLNNSTAPRALQFSVAGTVVGATVTVYADGTAIGTAVASSTTTLISTTGALAIPDGTHSFSARQTIPGLPESGNSTPLSIIIDTVAPATPVAPDLQTASDSGVSTTDNITRITTPTFDLATPTGAYYRAFRNGTLISASYGAGTSFTAPTQADGAATWTSAYIDAAGNASNQGAALSVMIDTVAPRITSSSVSEGDSLPTGSLAYVLQFNEAMPTANLDASDVTLLGNGRSVSYTASSLTYSGGSQALTLAYTGLPEDSYTLTLLSADGRFEDTAGNDLDGEPVFPTPPNTSGNGVPGGNFVVNFSTDAAPTAFPTLTSKAPVGSLIYDGNTSGYIGTTTDTDTFTLALDPGQTLTLVTTPGSTLRPAIQVLDPANNLLASATASAAGSAALIQTLPITAGGVYTIVISGAASTTGFYTVAATLNSAVESENNSGPANNTRAAAQDLSASFLSLGAGASRAAALGITDLTSSAGADYYSFTASAGDKLFLGFKLLSGSGVPAVILQSSAGTTLATAVAGSGSFDRALSTFTAPTSDTYYVFIDGTAAANAYSLVVNRNASFDLENNHTAATAQNIDGSSVLLGAVVASGTTSNTIVPGSLAGTEGNSNNYYPFTAAQMRYQQIYSASQFSSGGGIIDAIRFRRDPMAGAFSTTITSIQIDLAYAATSVSTISTTFASNIKPGGVTVFNGALSFTSSGSGSPNPFDVIIDVANTFNYNPALGDLVMDVRLFTGPNSWIALDAADGAQQSVTARVWNDGNVNATTGTANQPTGAPGSYGLVTRFDLVATGGNQDWYSINATAGANIRLTTATPAGGPHQFSNTLDPVLELYDPTGTKVAIDDNSAGDGRNALLNYTATVAGTYKARVLSVGSTTGEYLLSYSLDAPTPAAPDLIDASDTGASTTDNITRLNNTSPAAALAFSVANTLPGATVSLFADGLLIGTAVASGSVTTVFTNGTTTLPDGDTLFTARQTVGTVTSNTSTALKVSVDTDPPSVSADSLTTPDDTPPLTGAVSDPEASVTVLVGTTQYSATNLGNGSWSLADNAIVPALAPAAYPISVTATDLAGNAAVSSASLTVLPPLTLTSFIINDGSVQRSMVNLLTLNFNYPVTLDADAVHLLRQGDSPAVLPFTNPSGDGVTFVATFSGTGIVGSSLADGLYELTVQASKVRDTFSRTLVGPDPTFNFHRLFGDSDGNRTVNLIDVAAFTPAQNTKAGASAYRWFFDYDGDQDIDGVDALFFRRRQGLQL